MIPQTFIQDLLDRTNIVDLVGRYVQLKKAGTTHKGLCPFHGEKTPSFTVTAPRQTYHCFGCGVHGNAIGFLMAYQGLSFMEAVRELAQQAGLSVPENPESPAERAHAQAQKEKQQQLTTLLEEAMRHYRKQLKSSDRAVQYLKKRGLTGEICAHFGMGYAPDNWRGLASVFARYDDPKLIESGLVIQQGETTETASRYDRFRDRIMFPIRSIQGEVIGFGGRVLDKGEPKYLNSPETPVFIKGRELYGLFEARQAIRQSGYVLVVEGYMDVVALAQLGLPHVVATLGTACTGEHIQKLFRFTEQIVFSFDGDKAGRRAAGRALEATLPYATDKRIIKFLFLPAEHDPDSFIRASGRAAFEHTVQQAIPLSRQFISHASEGCDLASAEGRARFLSQAHPLWAALPTGALGQQLLLEIANCGHIHAAQLRQLWQLDKANEPFWHGPPDAALEAALPASTDTRAQAPGRHKSWLKGRNKEAFKSQRSHTTHNRIRPYQATDIVLRLLLLHTEWWASLSAEDHQLLHELPAAHGEIFTWLERYLENNGPTNWLTLRQDMNGQNFVWLAEQVMASMAVTDIATFQELRAVLNRLWVDNLNQQAASLANEGTTDQHILQKLREIHLRREMYTKPVTEE